jgi:hypothetical protein
MIDILQRIKYCYDEADRLSAGSLEIKELLSDSYIELATKYESALLEYIKRLETGK